MAASRNRPMTTSKTSVSPGAVMNIGSACGAAGLIDAVTSDSLYATDMELTESSQQFASECGTGLKKNAGRKSYRARKPIAMALAISMKNADTSGKMMNACAQAPCSLVTAVMLAMAVGVAPRLMPVKPAEITAAL